MRRFGLLCGFFLYLTFSANAVLAQEDAMRSASARVLFEEGVQFVDSSRWADAAERFQRALVLRDSPVIRYNLAAALVELGRVVEASEMLQQVQRTPAIDASLRQQTEQQLSIATSRMARLTIQLQGDPQGADVELDGRALSDALLGVAIPMDPGEHALKALRQGAEVDAKTFSLSPGVAETITLQTVHTPTPAEAARTVHEPVVAAPRAEEPRDVHGTRRHSKWLWWGVGGAVVVVTTVIVAGVLAGQKSAAATPYRGDFEPGSIPVQVAQ